MIVRFYSTDIILSAGLGSVEFCALDLSLLLAISQMLTMSDSLCRPLFAPPGVKKINGHSTQHI